MYVKRDKRGSMKEREGKSEMERRREKTRKVKNHKEAKGEESLSALENKTNRKSHSQTRTKNQVCTA